MPLYKVKSDDEVRLVIAASAAAALRHVTTPMFTVTAMTDPGESAELAASGIKVEKAGEIIEPPAETTDKQTGSDDGANAIVEEQPQTRSRKPAAAEAE